MKVVIDVEANGLINPTKIWVIVCKDINTGKYYVFRHTDGLALRFIEFARSVDLWIGHNLLGYDASVIDKLVGYSITPEASLDTLIVSKMVNYSRSSHSVEDYGVEFGLPKIEFTDFSRYSPEMEEYCKRDVDITERIYNKYRRYIHNPIRQKSIHTEQSFQLVCNDLEKNGFAFNTAKAQQLLQKVQDELATLDKDILSSFPPREVLIREFTPRATKFGTINRSSVPRQLHQRMEDYEVGKTYRHTRSEAFNP